MFIIFPAEELPYFSPVPGPWWWWKVFHGWERVLVMCVSAEDQMG